MQPWIIGAIHHTHAACANGGHELVRSQSLTRGEAMTAWSHFSTPEYAASASLDSLALPLVPRCISYIMDAYDADHRQYREGCPVPV